MNRDWREALPKWAVQAATDELAASKRRLVLRWPDEARPTPVPFQWGEYDRLTGTPVAGTYWVATYDGHAHAVHIREARAAAWLGIEGTAAYALFWAGNRDLRSITPTQAAAVLRHLAVTGDVDWSIGEPT